MYLFLSLPLSLSVCLSDAHTPSGEIINWVSLDREQQSQHALKVMVTDQGHPRLNATATVHILVTDVNDNPPQFTHMPAGKELNVQVLTCLHAPVHLTSLTEEVFSH